MVRATTHSTRQTRRPTPTRTALATRSTQTMTAMATMTDPMPSHWTAPSGSTTTATEPATTPTPTTTTTAWTMRPMRSTTTSTPGPTPTVTARPTTSRTCLSRPALRSPQQPCHSPTQDFLRVVRSPSAPLRMPRLWHLWITGLERVHSRLMEQRTPSQEEVTAASLSTSLLLEPTH